MTFFQPGINLLYCIAMASLLMELKDAELALGEEPRRSPSGMDEGCEGPMAEADGTEALIEALGKLSGRFQRSV